MTQLGSQFRSRTDRHRCSPEEKTGGLGEKPAGVRQDKIQRKRESHPSRSAQNWTGGPVHHHPKRSGSERLEEGAVKTSSWSAGQRGAARVSGKSCSNYVGKGGCRENLVGKGNRQPGSRTQISNSKFPVETVQWGN